MSSLRFRVALPTLLLALVLPTACVDDPLPTGPQPTTCTAPGCVPVPVPVDPDVRFDQAHRVPDAAPIGRAPGAVRG